MQNTPSVLENSKAGSGPFHPRRLAHVVLWTTDYQRAYDYYRNVMGFEHAYIMPETPACFLSNGNTYHDYALMDLSGSMAKPGQKPGLHHFAFELRNEIELINGYRKTKELGKDFDFTMDHDVARSVYRLDPEGNIVELYADAMPDQTAARQGVVTKKKPKYIPGESHTPISEELFPRDPEIRYVKEATFHPKKVAHLSLIAKNYEAMYDFYTQEIGLTPFLGSRSSDFCILSGTASSGDIVLYRSGDGFEPGLHHVGVEVLDENDLEAVKAELPKKNIKIVSDVSHPARRALTILAMDDIRTQFFANRDWRAGSLQGLSRQDAIALL
ncbi:MAG: VOC family protein [Xanthobacteraceae bacterium]